MHAGGRDPVVHGERGGDRSGVLGHAAPQAGDGDDPGDALPRDHVAQRQREVAEVALDAVGAGRGRHQPEHLAGPLAGRAQDRGVGVRALEHLGPCAGPGAEPAGVAGDDAQGGPVVAGVEGVQDAVEDLPADAAGRGGDDDHEHNSGSGKGRRGGVRRGGKPVPSTSRRSPILCAGRAELKDRSGPGCYPQGNTGPCPRPEGNGAWSRVPCATSWRSPRS